MRAVSEMLGRRGIAAADVIRRAAPLPVALKFLYCSGAMIPAHRPLPREQTMRFAWIAKGWSGKEEAGGNFRVPHR